MKYIVVSKIKYNIDEFLVLDPDKERDLIQEIKKASPRILVTDNLAGFDRSTLTDNVAYNLLGGIQIHFLEHEMLWEEKFLMKPLSLSMFFFCNEDCYDYYHSKFPELPYISKVPAEYFKNNYSAEEQMKRRLDLAIKEVIKQYC